MEDTASFKSPDGPVLGFFLLILGSGIVSLPLWMTEADFLGTRVRRGGGIIKMIEQSVGWTGFTLLAALFGLWLIAMGLVGLWKIINNKPDVTAYPDRLEYHPAVRRDATTYDDLSTWEIHFSSGHPVLTMRFHDSYWSLKGIIPRKSIVLEGGKEDLEALVNYLGRHPATREKFIRR